MNAKIEDEPSPEPGHLCGMSEWWNLRNDHSAYGCSRAQSKRIADAFNKLQRQEMLRGMPAYLCEWEPPW